MGIDNIGYNGIFELATALQTNTTLKYLTLFHALSSLDDRPGSAVTIISYKTLLHGTIGIRLVMYRSRQHTKGDRRECQEEQAKRTSTRMFITTTTSKTRFEGSKRVGRVSGDWW